ncbi:MAG: sulfite exporter TauE/SafE family protein [Clostridia bacterium]|nr:sulfite exporter TauE/SafE family protein [Clostridia bacterium]
MLSVLIGFFSGIVSGMGIGGGAILIPALIFTSGIDQKLAQGINLVYFLPTAVIALIIHLKNKNVDIPAAAVMGAFGCIGAVLGSLIAMRIGSDLLRRMFGFFLLLIGIREILKGLHTKKSDTQSDKPGK